MPKLEPMLAAKTTDEDLRRVCFPVLFSPKIDGIRARVQGGVLLSRKFIPIPNPSVQRRFGTQLLSGLDGELVVGAPNVPNCMQNSMAVTRGSGNVEATFYIFDRWDAAGGFHSRFEKARETVETLPESWRVRLIPHKLIQSYEELLEEEAFVLSHGYEGGMVRSLAGPYKNGRSTIREGYLLKVKRFTDGEARIIGFTEREHNGNEAELDAFGRTKRSSSAAGQVLTNSLGALIVEDLVSGVEFKIGSGFTEAQRVNFWDLRDRILGSVVRYKSLPIGVVDKPRHPTFSGFRSEIDL